MGNVKNKSVVACSGKLNRNGYRVMVEGIALDAFKANPIMLYQHNRSDKWTSKKEQYLPIGKWENIRVENGQLVADPIFDEGDDFAKEIKRKWENGFLNATSIGFNFIEFSEDPIYLVQGQTRPTVTKSELVEISIVDIPADADAVRINNAKDESDPLSILPLLSEKKDNNQSVTKEKKTMDKKLLCLSLGISESSTDEQVTAAINILKAGKVDAVLALGRQKGVVNDTNLAAMRGIVEQNPEFAKLSWEALPDVTTAQKPQLTGTLTEAIKELAGQSAPQLSDARKDWSIDQWRKDDPDGFLALEHKNPTLFKSLVNGLQKLGLAVVHNEHDKQA